MTVSYTSLAYSAGFGVYLRLLFRYRGSAYKMIWVEFLIFGSLYAAVSLIYRFALVDPTKTWLEMCIISVSRAMHQIPIGFVLGFYVGLIYNRFWKAFLAIPSPNKMAIYLTNYLHGNNEEAVVLRRTAIRYVCATFVLAMRGVNIPIRKRFPTVELVADSGLLTEPELNMLKKVEEKSKYSSTFLPLSWCACLVRRAFDKRMIRSNAGFVDIVRILDDFRHNCQVIFNYDTVNVPLCYTQAVTFGVYSYFCAAIIGYQFIPADRVLLLKQCGVRIPSDFRVDIVVPVFAIVQFFIYIGLMKVAEALLNPHGENDDDFEICSSVDKNLNNGNMIVTEMHADLPELTEDAHWDMEEVNLPHTVASEETEKSRSKWRFGSIFETDLKKGAGRLVRAISRRTSGLIKVKVDPPPNEPVGADDIELREAELLLCPSPQKLTSEKANSTT